MNSGDEEEIKSEDKIKSIHHDWVDILHEWLLYDTWQVNDGLLLMADIFPVDATVINEEYRSPRFGVIGPPVVVDAGIVTEEAHFRSWDKCDKEPALIRASKRLGHILRIWKSADHDNDRYPIKYYVEWAGKKGIKPCWIELFEHEKYISNISTSKPNQNRSGAIYQWPWGSHETELLRHLSAAAERFWVMYVPGEKDTAPTNGQVEDWLIERGVSSRVAEIMAQILRADGLPPGRRK